MGLFLPTTSTYAPLTMRLFIASNANDFNVKRILYAPTKYNFWILGTPLFYHFLDQCVWQYPSPLDNNAHTIYAAILLLVTGIAEFLYCTLLAECLYGLFWYVSLLVRAVILGQGWWSSIDLPVRQLILAFALLHRFLTRWPRYVQAMSRKCPTYSADQAPRLKTVVTTFFQFNPALIVYAILALIAKVFTGSLAMRVSVIRMALTIVAPSMDYTPLFSMMQGELRPLDKHYQMFKDKWEFLSLVRGSCLVVILEMAISRLPLALVNLTQWAQSHDTEIQRIDPRTQKAEHECVLMAVALRLERIVQTYFDALWRRAAPLILRLLRQTSSTCCGNYHATNGDSLTNIKLMQVKPGCASDAIECTLIWMDLAELASTTYTAVSYAWKSPKLTRTIIVNNQRTSITKSAFEVLHALRSSTHYKHVWLDALCIDQSQDADKRRQIPLMPRIYESANEVLVWLGDASDSALAFGAVQRLFLNQKLKKLTKAKTTNGVGKAASQALCKMLLQPWFTRAWVVQEVVRGHGKVKLRYGENELKWSTLSWCAQALRLNQELWSSLKNHSSNNAVLDVTLRNIEVINHFTEVASTTQPLSLLFHLVQMFRSQCRFDAVEIQDRIYALIGLCALDQSESIKVDYSMPHSRLYMDVVAHLASTGPQENRLDFLMHAGRGLNSTTPGLPSWTPDWSIKPVSMPIIGTDGSHELLVSSHVGKLIDHAAWFNADGQYQFEPGEPTKRELAKQTAVLVKSAMTDCLFHATKGCAPRFRFDGNVLSVRGQIVDEIEFISPGCPQIEPCDIDGWLRAMSRWARIAIWRPRGCAADVEMNIIDFLRTTIFDSTTSEYDLTFSTVSRLPASIDEAEKQGALTMIQVLSLPPAAQSDILSQNPEFVAAVNKLTAIWAVTCPGRVFVITKNNRVGMCLSGTKAGDLVALVHGVKVPLTLRRIANVNSDPCYELMGQTYIHGIMDGQAVESFGEAALLQLI